MLTTIMKNLMLINITLSLWWFTWLQFTKNFIRAIWGVLWMYKNAYKNFITSLHSISKIIYCTVYNKKKSQLCTYWLLTVHWHCTVLGWVDEHEVEQLSCVHWSMLMSSNHILIQPEGWKLCSITFIALLDYKPTISRYFFGCYTPCSIYIY